MSVLNDTLADGGSRVPAVEVSFAIACYNAMPYLEEAIQSALSQKDTSVEVIVVDDGSRDDSCDFVRNLAKHDSRVRLLETPHNMGPGGARNMAIEAMKGEWLAVLDADDVLLPDRSRLLIDAAIAADADMVADNLIVFGEGLVDQPFLSPPLATGGDWMTLERYVGDAVMFGRAPNPGFLKPMFRRRTLNDPPLRYNAQLRIAEDDELIMQLLRVGKRYLVVPTAGYRYRKHSESISHRLSVANCDQMVTSEMALRDRLMLAGPLPRGYQRRWDALLNAQSFVTSIDQIKNRNFAGAVATLLRRPSAVGLYRMPVAAQLKRLSPRS